MAKQLTNRERLSFKLDHLTETEINEVMEYVSIMESMRRELSCLPAFSDDLMSSLAAAYENRRARQVMEWENARQRAARM